MRVLENQGGHTEAIKSRYEFLLIPAKAASEGKSFKQLIHETLHPGRAAESRKPVRFQVIPLNPGIKPADQGLSMNPLSDKSR